MTAVRQAWAAEPLHYRFHELRPDQWLGRNDVVDGTRAVAAGNA